MMRNLKDYFPIVYVFLIFTGFLNNHFYYSRFDIEIYSYLTILEFLFSFLSFSIPLIIVICVSVIMLSALFFLPESVEENEEKEEEESTDLTSIKEVFSSFLNYIKSIKKRWLRVVYLPFQLALLGLSIVINVFLVCYPFVFVQALIVDEPYLNLEETFGVGIFWVIGLISKLSEYRNLIYVVIGSLFISFLWINGKERALNTLNGNPEFQVKLNLNGQDTTIVSDSILVYIGKTKDHLFLRDRNNDENIIFEFEDITEFRKKQFVK